MSVIRTCQYQKDSTDQQLVLSDVDNTLAYQNEKKVIIVVRFNLKFKYTLGISFSLKISFNFVD